MNNKKDFLIHIFLSGLIGVVIGGIAMLASLAIYIGLDCLLISLALSGLIGVIIGVVTKCIFTWIVLNLNGNLLLAYILEGISVVILTAIGSYLMGTREIILLTIMCSVACILAFLLTYIHYNKKKNINEKLKEYQSHIK